MKLPLLHVEQLSVSYGEVRALNDVNLQVPQGAIVTVIGANGAGKTTLLETLAGLLRGSGRIHFDGDDQSSREVEQIAARGLLLVPEKRELFMEMSVEDNLLLGAFLKARGVRRGHRAALAEVYDIFPRLRERSRQLAGTLSGGERQMLALGRALMARPKLLLLDEPSLGLAPMIVSEVFRVILQLRRQGVSILLVEQNARAALKVADYAYVLESGSVSFEGTSEQLVNNPRVVQAYLGQTKGLPEGLPKGPPKGSHAPSTTEAIE